MPIFTDDGFRRDDELTWIKPDQLGSGEALAVQLPNDADPSVLASDFDRIALISIPFSNFTDGRGFSLARRLRALGYRGRLRARGHVIPDQYRLARACGFDEVQIDAGLASRQPEHVWSRSAAVLSSPFHRRRGPEK